MNIKPFRDYDEHEVINLFAVSGASVNKGCFVTALGSGWDFKTASAFDDNSYIDTVFSARFNVPHVVGPATSGTPKNRVLGMLLKDVRNVDENGYPLKFEPRKAAEMDVVISGEAAPVVKRGVFLYSGIEGTPAFGSGLAISNSGDGSLKVVNPSASGVDSNSIVAIALGPKNDEGYALIDVKL
jgi:hypothetical protein